MTEASFARAPDRSFAEYLQDVAGDLNEEEYKALDATVSSRGSAHFLGQEQPPNMQSTPNYFQSPQLTEARSFVNGLLSPFSPLLKEKEQREEFLQYVSLQPCRKVSVVVRVLPVEQSGDKDLRCVFPHSKTDASSQIIRKPKVPRDMVVVNPTAFGKYIPSQVTMETARLVAQVAHISSEDWARLYEFHHVMWPDSQEDAPNPSEEQFQTMDSLGQAVAQDAFLEFQSSLVVSMGHARSCIGVDVDLCSNILSHCQVLMEQKAICTVSMVEILEDKDSFRDVFYEENREISVRHLDMKGAILQGLTQIPLDSVTDMVRSFAQNRHVDNTVVVTINFWENAVSHQLNKAPTSQITCVEMTPGEGNKMFPSHAVYQKSTVSLGLALRQLLLQASVGTEPVISYRESTLTKVLQRSLESSKVVLVASISQLSKDYESTLATLNYLRRLLVQPGKTASSPFRTDSIEEVDANNATSSKLQEYAGDEYLMEKIIADPRQRLARIFNLSKPPSTSAVQLDPIPSEDYQPVDYMIDMESNELPLPTQSYSVESNGGPVKPKGDGEEKLTSRTKKYGSDVPWRDPNNSTTDVPHENEEYLNVWPVGEKPKNEESLNEGVVPKEEWYPADTEGDMPPSPTVTGQSLGHLAAEPEGAHHTPDVGPVGTSNPRGTDNEMSPQHIDDGSLHPLDPELEPLDSIAPSKSKWETPGHLYPTTGGDTEDEGMLEFWSPTQGGAYGFVSPQSEYPQEAENLLRSSFEEKAYLQQTEHSNALPSSYQQPEDVPLPGSGDVGGVNQIGNATNIPSGDLPAAPVALSGLKNPGKQDTSRQFIESSMLQETNTSQEPTSTAGGLSQGHTEWELPEREGTAGHGDGTQKQTTPRDARHPEVDGGNARAYNHQDDSEDDDSYPNHETDYELPELSTVDQFDVQEAPQHLHPEMGNNDRSLLMSIGEPDQNLSSISLSNSLREQAAKPITAEVASGFFSAHSRSNGTHSPSATRQSPESRVSGNENSPTIPSSRLSGTATSVNGRGSVEGPVLTGSNASLGSTQRSDEFIGEIRVLEGAVNQIQNMQSGLWESSTRSLQRLKGTLGVQQKNMSTLKTEREDLQSTVAALKDDIEKLSEDHDIQLQQYEEEVEQMQAQLHATLEDKRAMEAVTDSAVNAQLDYDRKLDDMEHELEMSHQHATSNKEKLDSLRESHEVLRQRLIGVQGRNEELAQGKEESERLRSELTERVLALQEHKERLERERDSGNVAIEALKEEIGRREHFQGELEMERDQLKGASHEQHSELQEAKEEAHRLSLLLEKSENKRSHLEETNQKDKVRLSELEAGLRDREKMYEDLKAKYGRSEDLRLKTEQRAAEFEDRKVHLETTVEGFQSERSRFEDWRKSQLEEKAANEIQTKSLLQKVKGLEDERDTLQLALREHQTRQHEIESELRVSKEKLAETAGLLEEMSRVKADNAEMEWTMANWKIEQSAVVSRHKEDIANLRLHLEEQQRALKNAKATQSQAADEADAEITSLRQSLDQFMTELELSNKQRGELVVKLQSMEDSSSRVSKELSEKNEIVERCRVELSDVRKELLRTKEQETSQTIHASREIRRLEACVSELERECALTSEQRDVAMHKAEAEAHSQRSVSSELRRTQDELARQNETAQQLLRDLQKAESASRRHEGKAKSMESALLQFRADAKEKVGKAMSRQKDTSLKICRIEDEKKSLQMRLSRLQKERDACYRSLELGCERLSGLNTVRTNESRRIGLQRSSQSHTTAMAMGSDVDMTTEAVPELYLTSAPTGHLMTVRAEEIAACLAVSAKHSLKESQDERSKLRSQVYRLEEEKEAEVAALRSKIDGLERGLIQTSNAVSNTRSTRHSREPSDY